MNVTVTERKEHNALFMSVVAEVRYWDDAILNGEKCHEDTEYFPCKVSDMWCPNIEIDTGIIKNWDVGNTADIHFKVCDMCSYDIIDEENNVIFDQADSYVPSILSPGGSGYGDYIIMKIDENGKIENWNPDLIKKAVEEGDE